jgi:hypothetical protein
MRNALSLLWHIPGNIWRGAIAAAPLTQWWRAGAALAMSWLLLLLILIIWQGPWTLRVEGQRLDWLGYIALGTLAIVAVAIIALMDVGAKLKASRDGIEVDVRQEGDNAGG